MKHVLLAMRWYHPKLHRGVAAYARERGWHLNSRMALINVRVPVEWRGDGIITQNITAGHPLVDFLAKHREPRIFVEGEPPAGSSPWPVVCNDNRLITEVAVKHFLERGFRRFAFLGGWAEPSQRLLSFAEQLRLHGLPLLNLYKAIGGREDWDGQVTAWRRAVESFRDGLPLALFCETDNIAADAILLARESGMDVPGDVAILGVHNDELVCETSTIPISSVDNNLYGIGYRAAEQLDRLMAGEKVDGLTLVPPTQVVVRQSTDTMAVMEPEVAKAVRFLRNNYHFGINVGDMMEEASVSRRTLYALFKRHLGRTPAEELTGIRMEQAKKLLAQTSLPPKDVAERCGFSDIRTFYATFEREAEQTPGHFRRRSRIGAEGHR
jgi:LacI family transcriptional regulator